MMERGAFARKSRNYVVPVETDMPAALEELARELAAQLAPASAVGSAYSERGAKVYDSQSGEIYFLLNGNAVRRSISVQPVGEDMKNFLQAQYGKAK